MSKFNATAVVDAIVNAAKADGAFVRTLVEEREVAGKSFKAEPAVLAIAEGLQARIEAGDLDAACLDVYVSNARTMCECSLTVLIAACEEGYGRNGVCRRIRAMTGTKGKGGRPKGKPAAKAETKAESGAAKAETPSVPNADASWKQFLEPLRATVPGRKDWQSEDIVAFQDCASKMIALIARNAK
jgi:hypothetical protein